MSLRSGLVWGGLVLVILLGLEVDATNAQQHRAGDHVVVIREAKLGAAGQEDSDKEIVVPGLILKVENVNNQWLWVTNEKSGWLDRAHVIPVDPNAIVRLTMLISESPDDDVLRRARGLIRGRFGQFDGAMEDLKEAIRLKPSAETYNGRGRIYSENGKLAEAIADYTESLKLEPDNADVLNNRAPRTAV